MAANLLNQRWYVVGAPWLPSDMTPYITAGNEDPNDYPDDDQEF